MGGTNHGAQHLVHMANDIGNFFRGNPDHDAAVRGVSNHLMSYWTAKMRKKLFEEMDHCEDEPLDELPREALRLIQDNPNFKLSHENGGPEGGGDAG